MCPNVNCILDKMVLFVASRVSKASDIYTQRQKSLQNKKRSAGKDGGCCDDVRTHDSVLEEGVRKTSFFHQC